VRSDLFSPASVIRTAPVEAPVEAPEIAGMVSGEFSGASRESRFPHDPSVTIDARQQISAPTMLCEREEDTAVFIIKNSSIKNSENCKNN